MTLQAIIQTCYNEPYNAGSQLLRIDLDGKEIASCYTDFNDMIEALITRVIEVIGAESNRNQTEVYNGSNARVLSRTNARRAWQSDTLIESSTIL